MHAIAFSTALGIVAAINPGAAKNLLDIGGASGSYTQAFLPLSPEMRATIYRLTLQLLTSLKSVLPPLIFIIGLHTLPAIFI